VGGGGAWTKFPTLYELQRPKTGTDARWIAGAFEPYLAARDWVSMNRGVVLELPSVQLARSDTVDRRPPSEGAADG